MRRGTGARGRGPLPPRSLGGKAADRACLDTTAGSVLPVPSKEASKRYSDETCARKAVISGKASRSMPVCSVAISQTTA